MSIQGLTQEQAEEFGVSAEMWHEDEGWVIVVTTTVMTVLATVVVCLRYWDRLLLRRMGFGLDDWITGLCLLLTWATYGVFIEAALNGGIGKYAIVNILQNPLRYEQAMLHVYIGEILYISAIAAVKWSLLVMYYRIFSTRFTKYSTIILGAITVAWWISSTLVTIFQCDPVHGAWDVELAVDPERTPQCISHAYYVANAVPNIVTDVLILALPIYEIPKLHMKKSQRIALGGIFMLGALVIVASSVRLYVVIEMNEEQVSMQYELSSFVIWSSTEINTAIISASLPTLRKPLTMALVKMGLSRDDSNMASSEKASRERRKASRTSERGLVSTSETATPSDVEANRSVELDRSYS